MKSENQLQSVEDEINVAQKISVPRSPFPIFRLQNSNMIGIKISTSKNLISTIAIASCLLGMISPSKTQAYAPKEAPANTVELKSNPSVKPQANTSTKADQTKQTSRQQPKIGIVKSMVNGDLMCYVTLIDENNIKHDVGADFEICTKEKTFLNKKVRVSYELVSINDCQSAEPCGKTRKESIITKMEILGDATPKNPSNSQTLSNGDWTITIGNTDSWSGVNGTGNLSYRGCDPKGKCINLTGGRVTCRDGICTTGWSNGDYLYIIEQPINNPDRPEAPGSSTVLTVRKGSNVILKATGFKVVSPASSQP